VVVIDCYPGVDQAALLATCRDVFGGYAVVDAEAAARPIEEIDRQIAANLTDDRVLGVLSQAELADFYDPDRLANLARRAGQGPTVLVGWGAALVPVTPTLLVVADLPRYDAFMRQRAGAPNWRCPNQAEDPLRKYKRGYFVEWRVADRHKLPLLERMDFLLDTSRGLADAALIDRAGFAAGLDHAVSTPFRVVPYFDPGPWGGHWMEDRFGLPPAGHNYAWCFDCVPEENTLLLRDPAGREVALPSLDLVLTRPRPLLGDAVYARFGAEFPIRFDFLDTMGGGNLSLQVHPLTAYMREHFGLPYTQDESYYLLDAGDDAVVYLGLRPGTDPAAMAAALRAAQAGGPAFPADAFVNRYPVRRHDHVAIPAGTVHCSGRNSMVLEISATPYIFTFKMWDWGRLGLDGRPRPTYIDHALANIQWDRDDAWVQREILGQVTPLGSGDGWTAETTGLHRLEFIQTDRHWFTQPVPHDTAGTLNVLNLVQGDQVTVQSPDGAFPPVDIHYAETFIVPAAVGPYTITPTTPGTTHATVKAYVR
jgi:mannose-6-phosphate isomerase